jgi:hypothetical protein
MPGTHYSPEVRADIIEQWKNLEDDEDEHLIAARKGMPVRSVQSIIQQFLATNNTKSSRQENRDARETCRRLDQQRRTYFRMPLEDKNKIYHLIAGNHVISAEELQSRLQHVSGRLYSVDTIRRVRRQQNWRRRRQDRPRRAPDPVTQSQWKHMLIDMGITDQQLLFIDETHKASKDFYRLYGWAKCHSVVHFPAR